MICALPLVHNLCNTRILVEGLQFAYKECSVFKNFNIDTNTQLILLEGPSGCGKTTFLKLLSGVLTPSIVTTFLHPEPSRIILQEDSLFPWLTVEGNLELSGLKEIKQSPPAVQGLVPIVRSLANKHVYTLSFGQRRIVELFRVLSLPTPLVCLDEPFNFLDPGKRSIVAKAIQNLATEGICFVISSHYRDDFQHWNGLVYRFDGNLPVTHLEQTSIL
jgi:NitT/TauT family transport system ATP-binding protein